MKRIFNLKDQISDKQNCELYQLYKNVKNNESIIHNLVPGLVLPFDVTSVLSLGLKFSFPVPPNLNKLKAYFNEAIRKIGWRCFFANLDQKQDEAKRFFNILTKDSRDKSQKRSKTEVDLFSNDISDKFLNNVKSNRIKNSSILLKLLNNFKFFVANNDIVIKEADKNAGICVMKSFDYRNEILRQLNDERFYLSTTFNDYTYQMSVLRDDVLANVSRFPKEMNLKQILIECDKAAKFYVLPKVHKEFTDFPKGRPISSTIGTLNRAFSRILDAYLQPIMNHVPNVILDSTHFILLLENLKLCPEQEYSFITADIDALYTNLRITDCKKHCSMYYDRYRQFLNLPCVLEKYHINKLLKWSLDYSYIEFENMYFYQHQGIQMGNCASVSIANITVHEELRSLLEKIRELVCSYRFIDDIFMIVNSTHIEDINVWFNNTFTHKYLTFTFKHAKDQIDFLDLTVFKDSKNNLSTKLYSKPVNKHKFLHFKSAHPNHLLKSLPYSSGIRIVRSCTNIEDRNLELLNLVRKFQERDYPSHILLPSIEKLRNVDRNFILRPKKQLLISNLAIHNPSILSKYKIKVDDLSVTNTPNDNVYLVTPYYNTVFRLGQIMLNTICSDVKTHCANEELLKVFESLNFVVSYKKSNSLSDFLSIPKPLIS